MVFNNCHGWYFPKTKNPFWSAGNCPNLLSVKIKNFLCWISIQRGIPTQTNKQKVNHKNLQLRPVIFENAVESTLFVNGPKLLKANCFYSCGLKKVVHSRLLTLPHLLGRQHCLHGRCNATPCGLQDLTFLKQSVCVSSQANLGVGGLIVRIKHDDLQKVLFLIYPWDISMERQ